MRVRKKLQIYTFFTIFQGGVPELCKKVHKMKKAKLLPAVIIPLAMGTVLGCEDFGAPFKAKTPGSLRWTIESGIHTKADREVPDTNDFILTVRNSSGKVLYHGSYGDSPATLEVEPGSYTVMAMSGEFATPAFDSPQYGDEQVVLVPEGQKVTVHLECTLLNCGVKLAVSPDFLTAYPDGVLFLKQGSTHLMYAYTEKRTAYFFPGEFQLTMHNEGKEQTLLTRSLSPRDMLTLKISVPSVPETSGSVRIAVDTTKNWITDSYTIGGDNAAGTDPSCAISSGDARNHAGEKDVWVYGYIVGGDLTANGKSVKTSGITKATHLALASRSSVTDKASCVAVELPSGKVRDALNLVSHPELIGTRVYVKGDIVEAYFGTTGVKGTSDYSR